MIDVKEGIGQVIKPKFKHDNWYPVDDERISQLPIKVRYIFKSLVTYVRYFGYHVAKVVQREDGNTCLLIPSLADLNILMKPDNGREAKNYGFAYCRETEECALVMVNIAAYANDIRDNTELCTVSYNGGCYSIFDSLIERYGLINWMHELDFYEDWYFKMKDKILNHVFKFAHIESDDIYKCVEVERDGLGMKVYYRQFNKTELNFCAVKYTFNIYYRQPMVHPIEIYTDAEANKVIQRTLEKTIDMLGDENYEEDLKLIDLRNKIKTIENEMDNRRAKIKKLKGVKLEDITIEKL